VSKCIPLKKIPWLLVAMRACSRLVHVVLWPRPATADPPAASPFNPRTRDLRTGWDPGVASAD
jgi:hypothetical protein